MTIANSTFVHNIADRDGGLANSNMGTMTLTNTTVAQNVAANSGAGGIGNSNGIVLLQSSTVAENHGGALAWPAGALLTSTTASCSCRTPSSPATTSQTTFQFEPSDCSGPITSLGNNLIGDLT